MKPEPRFPIGAQFVRRGMVKAKPDRVATVIDIWTTTNSKGDFVHHRYIATYAGPMGQTITERDICETTVARNLIKQK
jgi:hypothetical protein